MVIYIEKLVRLIAAVITRLVYRVRFFGRDNIPATGGVLIICNHVSYADAPMLDTACARPIRFIMDRDFYNIWFLKPFCKLVRTIPISAEDPPKKIIASMIEAKNALKAGEIVCIFAEGAMTRNGNLLPFKNGYERIARRTGCKIVPAYIGGMWGSIFSFYYGKTLSTLPKVFRRKAAIHFGKPLPNNATSQQIRQSIQELSCDHINTMKSRKRSLSYRFIKAARRNWFRRCISDSTGKKLSYGKTLIASVALKKQIEKKTAGREMVGIMLPPSAGGAIANIAVTMLAKVPVNLNYTMSPLVISSAIEQCGIKTVITSRSFVEKLPELKNVPNLVMLEDISKQITGLDKFTAFLKARFVPKSILAKTRRHNPDNLATIVFSSGSSGKPKGVMLSHHNILSNIDAMVQVFRLKTNDNLCAPLPFFHVFGYTCSLWLCVVNGVSAGFVANPLDGAAIGAAARENCSTVLFAAPTFLLNYIRRVELEDFGNLRLIMVGAEKLKTKLADAFEEKFGIRPRQGYGTTELSPAVSFNIEDVEISGMVQTGTKDESVGEPIPGVAVRIVNPETHEPLPVDSEGLLMVKSPGVMIGYYNRPQETAEVLDNRWYNTGDIAKVDSDGFITITGRLSRFSKIAGEMVPHSVVEETLHKELNIDGHTVAVTSIPDKKKGEQLIVLHTGQAGDTDRLHTILTESDLPNIYKPKRDNYICVDKIPMLGSGKLDLMKLKQIAVKMTSYTLEGGKFSR